MPKMFHRPGKATAFLATPVYGSPVAGYTHSLFYAKTALQDAGISSELAIYAGNCHVDDSRNVLVQKFLESGCDYLVFIDADLCFRPECLVKLCQHEKDVVAATYPFRQEEEAYPVIFWPGDIRSEDGLIEVCAVPTGFLKISRHALETLAGEAKMFHMKQSDVQVPLIFERELEQGFRRGGDYAFCRKWREHGKIYLDPEIELDHYGETHWTGSVGAHLRTQLHGPILARLLEIEYGMATDQTFLNLVKAWDNDWSGDAVFLYTAAALAKKNSGNILEVGSGLSTLVMAAANPNATIYALEHDPEWIHKLSHYIQLTGYNNIVLCHAPIVTYDGFQWYSTFPDKEWSAVILDGPPRKYGREGLFHLMDIGQTPLLADDAEDPKVKALLDDFSQHTGREYMVHGQKERKIALFQ